MNKEYTTKERLKYLEYKVNHKDTPTSERFAIIDFYINHVGLFGKELKPIKFLKELGKLTIELNQTIK